MVYHQEINYLTTAQSLIDSVDRWRADFTHRQTHNHVGGILSAEHKNVNKSNLPILQGSKSLSPWTLFTWCGVQYQSTCHRYRCAYALLRAYNIPATA